MLTIHFRTSS